MSLYPGGKNPIATGNYSVANNAMVNSMAQVMENEFAAMFTAIKGKPMPDNGQEDRRILFSAIARGVLKYLHDKQNNNITALTNNGHTHQVNLNVTMDQFIP